MQADRESLTVAMTIVPGILARNRFFQLHTSPDVRWAKRRSAELRGMVRQLADPHGGVSELTLRRTGPRASIEYRIARLHVVRRASLSHLELACILVLTDKASGSAYATEPDKQLVESSLRRLGGDLLPDGRGF